MSEMPPIRKRILSILIALTTAAVTAACDCSSVMAASDNPARSKDDHACCHVPESPETPASSTPIPDGCLHCQSTFQPLQRTVSQLDCPALDVCPIFGADGSFVPATSERRFASDEKPGLVRESNSLLRQHCALNL